MCCGAIGSVLGNVIGEHGLKIQNYKKGLQATYFKNNISTSFEIHLNKYEAYPI
jgi:hypothetical protein